MAILSVERCDAILALLHSKGHASVKELCDATNASESTIRRNLDDLAARGLLRRTHGGGSANTTPGLTNSRLTIERTGDTLREKRAIALAALDLIHDGETIFLGSGSTVLQLAKLLTSKKNLTVISNSLTVIIELHQRTDLRLIMIGGVMRQTELSFIGHLADIAIAELKATRAFLGTEAIHVEQGLTHQCLEETLTDRKLLAIAPDLTILADHSKFNVVKTSFWAPLSVATRIITDDQLDSSTRQRFQAAGATLLIAFPLP